MGIQPKMGRRKVLALAAAGTLAIPVAKAAPLLGVGKRTAADPNSWIEVNLRVFEQNLQNVQQTPTNNAKLCAIMKADAYGAGIEGLVPSLIKAGVPCIGIASTEEARVVRAAGFKGQLMRVRSATPGEVEAALAYNVEELIGNAALAREVGAVARRRGRVLRVHLSLNSGGMSRNGLELATDSGKADAQAILEVSGLRVVGVMTHFAVDERPYTLKGLEAFKSDCDWLFANTNLTKTTRWAPLAACYRGLCL